MRKYRPFLAVAACLILLAGCDAPSTAKAAIERTGFIQSGAVNEASGLQSAGRNPDAYFVHNDDGKAVVYAMDEVGRDLGRFEIEGAGNRDWEDLTRAPSADGPLLVIGDIGDNGAQWQSVFLLFVPEPATGADGRYSGSVALRHRIELRYPDGARDCESLAYDPASRDLLLLSKRDTPPRIYRIPLATALTEREAELEFAGETTTFRPPTSRDMLSFGHRDGPWVSQPTGFDIRPDGRQAAVISYRSTYLFERREGETWARALARPPVEFEGPPSHKEEAIAYAPGGASMLIATEGIPAPLYRLRPLSDP